MSGAPFKELPASPSVSNPSVPIADRGGEEVNVGFSDFGAGSGNQLRDPRLGRVAGNDRKFGHGNDVTFHDKCVRFSDKFVVTIRAGSFLAANDRAVPLECDQILWKKRRQIIWKLTVTVV